MSDSWRAEQRQGLLSESVDAGMDGEPQVTQGPVSEKAVAVSQAHPGAMHLDLRDYLLAAGYAGQDDPS